MSAVVLGLTILLTILAVVQVLHRISLPTDGWGMQFVMREGRQQFVFDTNRAGTPSPLQHGDVLLAIEGRSIETIVGDVHALRAEPPAAWVAGQTVTYTVLRDGSEVRLDVSLKRLTLTLIPGELAKAFLTNPSALASPLIALLVFFRRPGSNPARLLLLLCVSYFVSDGLTSPIGGLNVGPADLLHTWTFWTAHFFRDFIWTLIIGPVYAYLFLTFPVVKNAVRHRRRLTLASLFSVAPVMLVVCGIRSRNDPLIFWPTWTMLSWVSFLVIVGGVAIATAHTLIAARNATHRAQVRWVAWGVLVMSAGLLTGLALDVVTGPGEFPLLHMVFHRFPMLAFPVSLAIAILRYRLFEIDSIINRTVVYGLLTAVLASVYILTVILLQELFRVLSGQRSNVAIAVSTVAIAALFVPVRSRLQLFIDRRFYRRRYDASQIMASFREAVRDEVDIPALSRKLVAAVEETVQPSHVSLWLRFPKRRTELDGETHSDRAALPSVDGNEMAVGR